MQDTANNPKNQPVRKRKVAGYLAKYAMLMIELMRLSPSYKLAHLYKVSGWSIAELHEQVIALYEKASSEPISAKDKATLLQDFEQVLKNYEEFGDIYSIDFDAWLEIHGERLFGFASTGVKALAQLDENEYVTNEINRILDRYLQAGRADPVRPPMLLLSVPLGVAKRKVLSQVSKHIDQAGVPVVPMTQKAKIKFAAKRMRAKPLFMYIALLFYKSIHPQMSLWQLGIKAKVSAKHSEGMDYNSKLTTMNRDQRIKLSILTSRALKRAKIAAENAARGIFPSIAERPLPYFDWDVIYATMRESRPILKPRKSKRTQSE